MPNKFALFLLKLAYKFLPNGYTVKAWKWPNGQGNLQVFTCPYNGYYMPEDALYLLHK